jgi:hypothetical protein
LAEVANVGHATTPARGDRVRVAFRRADALALRASGS